MKTILVIIMLSSIAMADRKDAETSCIPYKTISLRFQYRFTKKWDKTHFEMRGILEPGIFETNKDMIGLNISTAKFHYDGSENKELRDGTISKVDYWKECDK